MFDNDGVQRYGAITADIQFRLFAAIYVQY